MCIRDSLGEETITGTNQLVAVHEQALWALDLGSGEWDGPLTGPRTFFLEGVQEGITLSESGTRAYSIADDSLVTFDFVVDGAGALDVLVNIQQIEFSEVQRDGDSSIGVLYADDDVVFIHDQRSTWSLDAPARQAE